MGIEADNPGTHLSKYTISPMCYIFFFFSPNAETK